MGPAADAGAGPAVEPRQDPLVLVVMGVAGSGKSTVAGLLAARLDWPFAEGDALHPPENVAKMAAGHPLTDADRMPWLRLIADWVDARLDAGGNGIVTCSALKRAYRDVIAHRGRGVRFVYLAAQPRTIAARLAARRGHFMPPALLPSQFADLEEPGPDEPVLRVEVADSPEAVARGIAQRLGLVPGPGAQAGETGVSR
ncbi:MAG TPA: gluconokinase [Kineosporiaceae bacterium]|nr:gluconokinase [Kineosporiaceae bacterium]